MGTPKLFYLTHRSKASLSDYSEDSILFANTNILYGYAGALGLEVEISTVLETFFTSCFKEIYYGDVGEFIIGDRVFEVGGKNKDFTQIKDVPIHYLRPLRLGFLAKITANKNGGKKWSCFSK